MLFVSLLVFILVNGIGSVPLSQFFEYNSSYVYLYSMWANSSYPFTGYSYITLPNSTYFGYELFPLPFYGRSYDIIWQHGNGYMSFNSWYSQNWRNPTNPTAFPLNTSDPVIAGFWTDTSYPNNGTCNSSYYYYYNYNGCTSIYTRWPNSVDNVTRSNVTTYLQRYLPNERPFTPRFFLSTTWSSVLAEPNQTNTSNTFQMSYTTDGVRSFVFLMYNNLQWSQNGNSSHALAGFSAGDRISYMELPYSGTDNVTQLVSASNVGVPGLFIFRTDQAALSARCSNALPITSFPYFGSLFGSTPVFIQGPCFANTTAGMLRCRFGPTAIVDAIVVNEFEAMCLTPPSVAPGFVEVYFSTNGGSTFTPVQSYFYYMTLTLGSSLLGNIEMSANNRPFPVISPGEQITFTWYFSSWTQSKWPENGTMSLKIQMSTVTLNNSNNGLSLNSFITIQTGIIPSSDLQSASVTVPSIGNKMEAVVFRVLAQDNGTGTIYGALHSTIFIMNTGSASASNYCRIWMAAEPAPSTWNQDLMACPMTLTQARAARCCYGQDWSCFETWYNITGNCAFRQGRPQNEEPSAISCFQSWNTNQWGARSECCYDQEGQLITRGPGAGTDDRYHSFRQPIRHFFSDLMPFLACCHLSSDEDTCDGYLNLRPPRRGSNTGFTWGGGWGDPHYTTLDGSSYTFNGYGEYTYLAVANASTSATAFNPAVQSFSFMSQVRTTPRILFNGSIVDQATVTRGFAGKSDHPQAERVSVIVSKLESILVHRGNETIDFTAESEDTVQQSTIQSFTYPEMIIERNRTSKVIQLSWYIGISVIITPISITSPALTVVLNIDISIDESMKNRTFGLLGPYDDSPSNDMRAANGTVIGQADSLSLDVIHIQFGQTWAIDPNQSLFYYEGNDSATFYGSQNINFTPSFGPANMSLDQENSTRAACNISAYSNQSSWSVAQRTCYYDVSMTGDTSFGRSSLVAANAIVENTESQRNPPLFNSNLPTAITANVLDNVTLNFTATSEYGTAIIYILVRGPINAYFDNQTGRFEWQIPASVGNITVITVSAEDNQYYLMSTYDVTVSISGVVGAINSTVPTTVMATSTTSGSSTHSLSSVTTAVPPTTTTPFSNAHIISCFMMNWWSFIIQIFVVVLVIS